MSELVAAPSVHVIDGGGCSKSRGPAALTRARQQAEASIMIVVKSLGNCMIILQLDRLRPKHDISNK
jgi:hypothetical protein